MLQVTTWFANKRNRTGNTRSRRKRQTLENGVLTLCEMLFRQQNPVAAAAANGGPFAGPSATSTSIPLSIPPLSLHTYAADGLHSRLDPHGSLTLPPQQLACLNSNNNHSVTRTFPFPLPGAPGSTGSPFNTVPFSSTAVAAAQGQENPPAAAAAPAAPANGGPFAATSATCTTVPLLPLAVPVRMYDSNGLSTPLDSHSLPLPLQQHTSLNSNPSLTGTGAFAQGSTGFPFGAGPFSLTAAAAAQGQQLLQPVWPSAFPQNSFNPYNTYNPFNAPSVSQNNHSANNANFLQNPFQNQNQQGSEATSTGSTTSFSGANSSIGTNSINPWWTRQIPLNNLYTQFAPPFPQIPNTE